jgi:serine/threonine protein phosphatase PrpC
MSIKVGGASLKGVRSDNQDRFFVRVSPDGERAIGAIADGIGGLADGAGAAAAAVGAVEAFCAWLFDADDPSPSELRERVLELYRHANESIVERTGSRARSGTTLVFIAVTEEHRIIANVGDSRAFRLHDGELTRMTMDHSVVEELVRDGALTPEQAERSPYRNLLTRSLGDAGDPEVDVESVDRNQLDTRPGTAVILTSDGVHDVPGLLTAERVQQAIDEEPDLEAAADRLCRAAIEAGSRDNATMVIGMKV